jgi:osmotically inducible protein OsmC
MSVNVLYKTSSTATGGRDGRSISEDGTLDITMSTPKELGGNGKPGNNPEQLFATGYAACFIGAMKFVAAQEKLKVPDDTTVKATVGIGPRSEGGFGLDISLAITLPGLSEGDKTKLVNQAHEVCPYSNATRGNIDVKLNIL